MPDPRVLFRGATRKKKHSVKTMTCAECHGDGGGVNGPDCKVCGGSGEITIKIIDKNG